MHFLNSALLVSSYLVLFAKASPVLQEGLVVQNGNTGEHWHGLSSYLSSEDTKAASGFDDDNATQGKTSLFNNPKVVVDGKESTLEKLEKQGQSAIVYKVIAGAHVGAFAKVPKTGSLRTEAANTATVGQLLVFGIDTGKDPETKGKEVMIVKAANGQHLLQTEKFKIAKTKGKTVCLEVLNLAKTTTLNEAERIVKEFKLDHGDMHLDNIFLNPELTRAELIDWGSAKKRDTLSLVTKQQINLAFADSLC